MGKGILAAVGKLAHKLPEPNFGDISDYESRNFYPGHSEFATSGKRGARWRLGYARRSLVPDDYNQKDYYIAGYLSYPPNVMSGVIDDQAVRVICLDDSSGAGASFSPLSTALGYPARTYAAYAQGSPTLQKKTTSFP